MKNYELHTDIEDLISTVRDLNDTFSDQATDAGLRCTLVIDEADPRIEISNMLLWYDVDDPRFLSEDGNSCT